MHICMVTLYHSPLDNRIYYQEAVSLMKAGFKVSMVVAANEQGFVQDMGYKVNLNPNGESKIDVGEMEVHIVKPEKGFIQALLKKGFRGKFYKRMIEAGIKTGADAFHAHEPESLVLAMRMAEKLKAKTVFDSHESWSGGPRKEQFVKRVYLDRLKYLITANELTRGSLLHRNMGMETEVIYNYPRHDVLNPEFKEDKFAHPVIVHEGFLPFNRGLKDILNAFLIVSKEHDDVKLKIIGAGPEEENAYTKSFIKQHGLEEKIILTGWVDYEKVGDELNECSIGLITKTFDVRNNILGGPSIKVFNYLLHGIAIVDVGLHESARFMDKYQSGITTRKRSVESIAAAINTYLINRKLLEQHCRNAFLSAKELNWESEGDKLIRFYKDKVFNNSELIIR